MIVGAALVAAKTMASDCNKKRQAQGLPLREIQKYYSLLYALSSDAGALTFRPEIIRARIVTR